MRPAHVRSTDPVQAMSSGIPYVEAMARYTPGATPAMRNEELSIDELLKAYHPDHGPIDSPALGSSAARTGEGLQEIHEPLLVAQKRVRYPLLGLRRCSVRCR